MFRNVDNTLLKRAAAVVLALGFMAAGAPAGAQDPARGPVREPNAPAIQDEPAARAAAADAAPNSFVESFLRNVKNGVGFSVAVNETYVPQFLARTGGGFDSATFTTLSPRLFFGHQRNRSDFLFDYSFGYRRYSRDDIPESATHSAGLSYRYRASSAVTLTISNEVRSAVNDTGFSAGSATFSSSNLVSFDQSLYLARKRMSTEQLRGAVDIRAGKRTNLGVYTTYNYWKYHDAAVEDTQAAEVGIRGSHLFNRWLSFDNSYSHYFGTLTGAPAANIERLQVGGLSFKTAHNLEFSFGGGIESANSQGRQTTTRASVNLAKKSKTTGLALGYHRGFSLAVSPGGGALIEGDNIAGSVTQWLGHGMNLKLFGLYTRGNAVSNERLTSYSGDASLEIALGNHVLITGQYGYVSQQTAAVTSLVPNASRSSATVGLQYFLSSLKGF